MNEKILIIEDEPQVASFIKKGLEHASYIAEVSANGETGIKKALSKKFDAIIVDLNLPKVHGFDVCKRIRENDERVPILILTAIGTTSSKLKGFEIGADDYLLKPFEFEELLARIKSLLKRNRGTDIPENNILRIADLEMDLKSKIVKREGKIINLTAKEFTLLEYFLRNIGKVITREDIAEKIWDINFDTGTNIIDVYIFYLRNKIEKKFSSKLIHTKFGMGFVMETKDTQ